MRPGVTLAEGLHVNTGHEHKKIQKASKSPAMPSLNEVNEATSHHWVKSHVHHVWLTTGDAEGLERVLKTAKVDASFQQVHAKIPTMSLQYVTCRYNVS